MRKGWRPSAVIFFKTGPNAFLLIAVAGLKSGKNSSVTLFCAHFTGYACLAPFRISDLSCHLSTRKMRVRGDTKSFIIYLFKNIYLKYFILNACAFWPFFFNLFFIQLFLTKHVHGLGNIILLHKKRKNNTKKKNIDTTTITTTKAIYKEQQH